MAHKYSYSLSSFTQLKSSNAVQIYVPEKFISGRVMVSAAPLQWYQPSTDNSECPDSKFNKFEFTYDDYGKCFLNVTAVDGFSEPAYQMQMVLPHRPEVTSQK